MSIFAEFLGKFVIVRTHDAGVHAGILEEAEGRSCRLSQSRRLWYWKTPQGAFLSGVATYGLHPDSRIGEPIDIILTEDCEIIICSEVAAKSIKEMKSYEPQ